LVRRGYFYFALTTYHPSVDSLTLTEYSAATRFGPKELKSPQVFSGAIFMKSHCLLLSGLSLLIPAAAMGQSVFDGTWKVDLKSEKYTSKPMEYLLKDGEYSCRSCSPPYTIKADGKDHKVSVSPYFDTQSITIVDQRTVSRIDKKDGEQVGTLKIWVSEDGKTLHREFSRINAPGAPAESGVYTATRLSTGPDGSHAISGTWHQNPPESLSENAQSITFKVDGDMLTMTSPLGDSFTAKMDGTEAPVKGDRGADRVRIKKISPNTLEQTYMLGGKLVSITTMTVSADGKTMKSSVEFKVLPVKVEDTFIKQQ
jgi:hypothetical protein